MNEYGFKYEGAGIYDKDSGELLEAMPQCPDEVEASTVWEGSKQDWKDTFLNQY